jgi:hypothetical protein
MARAGKEREVKRNTRARCGVIEDWLAVSVLSYLGDATHRRWHNLLDVTKHGGLWRSPAVDCAAATGAGPMA